MDSHEFLHSAIIYLGAALVAVPLAHRLGLGSVLGYLAAGVAIGPSALALIRSPEQVLHFAEIGVVFLLFLIGLELNPRRLWQLRRPIFGMGGVQVLACAGAAALVALPFGLGPRAALTLGMGFAMSSTALSLQLLRERNLHQLPVGEASFAVLLFQDLAVIPMLAVLPLLAPLGASPEIASAADRWIPIAKGVAAILAVVAAGRYVVRPLFRLIAETHLRELFTGFALALVFGVSYLMQAAGLSMALGAFLAGVLLADSEFRHELEVDIEPFKGLLLGLFFIAVGMSMKLSLVAESPVRVLSLLFALLSAKVVALHLVARLFRHSREEANLFAVALSQGGEFAFVLFGVGNQLGILGERDAGVLNIVVALSMACTPLLFVLQSLHARLGRGRKEGDPSRLGEEHQVRDEGNAVIIAGYGRIGQVIGRLLRAQGISATILEQDPGQIETMRNFGVKAFYGDVTRLDLLRAAGADQAKLLVLAIDDMEAAKRTIQLAKEHFPRLRVLARAEDRIEAYRIHNLGVPVVRSTFAPGLEMGREALKLLGYPSYEAQVIAARFERYDKAQFAQSARHVDDIDALISLSAQSRTELTRIMETDDRKRGEIVADGWG